MKENLRLQTKKEYNKEVIKGFYYNKEENKKNIDKTKKEIKDLKGLIKTKKTDLSLLKLRNKKLNEYKKQHTYERWIKEVRESNKNEYNIIENKDSLKIKEV